MTFDKFQQVKLLTHTSYLYDPGRWYSATGFI